MALDKNCFYFQENVFAYTEQYNDKAKTQEEAAIKLAYWNTIIGLTKIL